jgi:nitroreductase
LTDRAETFSQIANERRSIRGFRPEPLSEGLVREIFSDALHAPSNCNTQPWFVHVATGQILEELRAELPQRFAAGDMSLDYPYDGKYEGVYKERQYASATVLYDALGIPREEKAKRQTWFLRNFSFFDAPAVAFFTLPESFGLREACDLGMFAQTVMLGITARGLGSCPQTALGFMAHVIKPALNIPKDQKLLFGLSFGYPDDEDPANKAITDRARLEDVVRFNA